MKNPLFSFENQLVLFLYPRGKIQVSHHHFNFCQMYEIQNGHAFETAFQGRMYQVLFQKSLVHRCCF